MGAGGSSEKQIEEVQNKIFSDALSKNQSNCNSNLVASQTINGTLIAGGFLVKRNITGNVIPFQENEALAACNTGLDNFSNRINGDPSGNIIGRQEFYDTLSAKYPDAFIKYPKTGAILNSDYLRDENDILKNIVCGSPTGDGVHYDQQLLNVMSQICEPVGVEVVVANNHQCETGAISLECLQNVKASNSFQTDIDTAMDQTLDKNEDFVSTFADGLEGALKGNKEEARQQMKTITKNRINNINETDLTASISMSQTMIFDADASLWAVGNGQHASSETIMKALSSITIDNTVNNKMVDALTQTQTVKSDSIGDILKAVDRSVNCVTSGFSEAIIVLMVIGVVLLGTWLGVALWLMTRKKAAAKITASEPIRVQILNKNIIPSLVTSF